MSDASAELVKQCFKKFDVNREGVITLEEMRGVVQAVTMWSDERLNLLFDGIDANKHGQINYVAFTNWVFSDEDESKSTTWALLHKLHEKRAQIANLKECLKEAQEASECVDRFGPELAALESKELELKAHLKLHIAVAKPFAAAEPVGKSAEPSTSDAAKDLPWAPSWELMTPPAG